MNKTYPEISVFNKQNPDTIICIGKILLDNTDGWFEGVELGQGKFLFGIF